MAMVVTLVMAVSACSPAGEQEGAGVTPRVPVVVATAVQKPVPGELRAIGNVQPSDTVTMRPRVGGVVAGIHFREGQDVTAGQLLLRLDGGPLEAELREAEANLARSVAQLANARRDAERYAELARQGFVAQQEYDRLRTAAQALEGTVAADRAVVANTRLRLGYATIRAPITGRTGALLVHLGDLVTANETPLVVINRLRPVDVAFALPERELPEIRRYEGQGTLHVAVRAPDTGIVLGEGGLTFIDNRVDPGTGTIQLKATLPNGERALWPGQYVNVVVTLATEPAALVVPTPAVQRGQQGAYVFVVRPDQTVESRAVTVAREVDGETVLAAGLAPGETVVTEGQLRLVPSARVDVKPALAPPAAAPGGASGSAAGSAQPVGAAVAAPRREAGSPRLAPSAPLRLATRRRRAVSITTGGHA